MPRRPLIGSARNWRPNEAWVDRERPTGPRPGPVIGAVTVASVCPFVAKRTTGARRVVGCAHDDPTGTAVRRRRATPLGLRNPEEERRRCRAVRRDRHRGRERERAGSADADSLRRSGADRIIMRPRTRIPMAARRTRAPRSMPLRPSTRAMWRMGRRQVSVACASVMHAAVRHRMVHAAVHGHLRVIHPAGR